MPSAEERREELKAVYRQASVCTRCPQLASTRQTVVFGSGNADADLMFVGEAPGANEDKQGVPFVGQAGKLLDQLLGEIGLTRPDVFVVNVLKCLRYNAPVQLGDGSWERIGRLVKQRYAGTVMSVDERGQLVPRRVTGWHETPRGERSLHRMSYRSAKRNGLHRAAVDLTGDHPVLTERGYVPVKELRDGDRVATGQGLSALARDVVCGTLLGDGTLNASSAYLGFGHSERQSEHAAFKAELVRELSPRSSELVVAAVAGGPPQYGVVHVRTLAHRALGVLRTDFYEDRKKRVPTWVADALNPRRLAVWFMDDGYTRIRPGGRQPLAEIATNAFSDQDRQVLLHGLNRLGLPAKASRRRLYFDVPTTRRLSELIAPFVPASMRYKLHPEVEGTVPFDSDGLAPGPPEVMYDEVVVEEIEPGPDQTFFCIDVEQTHNFVTSGGVVHNCRPPGNRDPLPQEIDNCQDYLFRQLELIEPRVVCTLGNFATKLLRADPSTGITRLHGREEIRVIGPRAVRLFPIYHPAAALYTRSLLETLQADFALLPDLLALDPPPQPEPQEPEPIVEEPELVEEIEAAPEPEPNESQLGLF
jgi:uracil-DNA glycosylase family 4